MSKVLETIFTSTNLKNDKNGTVSPLVLKASVLVLLEAMARHDGKVDKLEYNRLIEMVTELFPSDEDHFQELHDVGVALRKQSHDYKKLIGSINLYYSDDQKTLIIAAAWKIACADNVIDQREIEFAQHLAEWLGLSSLHLAEAKRIAEAELGFQTKS